MNRCRNHAVIKLWKDGVKAINHKRSLTSVPRPDGCVELFSYNLKIGHRTPAGVCVVADFTAKSRSFYSMTTSCHVNKAKEVAGLVMHPKVWQVSPVSDEGLPF